MINLNHKFALLEDGTIEPLFYEDGERRCAYKEDGKFIAENGMNMLYPSQKLTGSPLPMCGLW